MESKRSVWLTDWMGSKPSGQTDDPPKWFWNVHSYAACCGKICTVTHLNCTKYVQGRKLFCISNKTKKMLASPLLVLLPKQ